MSNITLANCDFTVAWHDSKCQCLEAAKNIIAVSNDSELNEAGELQTKINKLLKKLEKERKEITAPLDEAKKQLLAEEKRLAEPLQKELDRIKKLTSNYATECARLIEEKRREAELAERRAAEAALAAEEADPYGFNTDPTPVAMPTPIIDVPKMPTTTHNRMVEKWDFQILDANAVPPELCSPDERKIRAFLAARKAEGYKADQVMVKGLKIISTMQVQSR